MKCPKCSESLKWQEQNEYKDFNLEGDGVIGTYNCVNNECMVDDVYIFTLSNGTL